MAILRVIPRIRPQMELDDGKELIPVVPAAPSLAGRIASGTIWLGGVTAVSRVLGLCSQFALMWLLMPEHFGTLGLVQTITIFATHLTSPGTDDVLLQKGAHLHRWSSAAFWLNLACGFAGGGAMVLLGLAVVTTAGALGNNAYGSPIVLKMIIIYAIGAPINAISSLPFVMLRAQLRFGRLAMIQFLEMLCQHSLMVLFAWKGFGAYSFALPMPIIAVARTTALWLMVRPKVQWHLGLHRWPHLAVSTGYVLGYRILQTGWHHGDQIVLGVTYADKVINGHYQSAVQLTQQIVRVVCENLLLVLVPALTLIRNDQKRLEGAVATACRALGSMMIPLATLQIFLAGPVIRMMFPERWAATIPLVQWLSFSPLIFAAAYPMMAMITATGRFKAAFRLAVVNVLLFYAIVIPATVIGAARGAAIGVAIFYWTIAHLYAAVAFRSMRGIKVLHRAIARTLVSAAVAAVPAMALVHYMPTETRLNEACTVAVVTPIFLGVYAAMLHRLDPQGFSLLRRRLGGAIVPIIRRLISVGRRPDQPAQTK